MSNLCIIPARGGSKRIPRKNIKDFLGKPIIAYSIEVALQSKLFDEVMVSTDDEEIAEVARRYGAIVPFIRDSKNSNDFATLSDVIIEVLDKTKLEYNYICTLLATAPFVTTKQLIEGYNIVNNNKKIDSILSVVENSKEVLRSFLINKEEELEFTFPEYKKSRSQDLPKTYKDAGIFYISKPNLIKKNKKLTSGKVHLFEVN